MLLEEALPCAEEGLTCAERAGDERLVAGALMIRSLILLEGPHVADVIPDIERSLAIWRRLEDVESQATVIALLGVAYQRNGDYEQSKPLLAESVHIHVRLGSYGELIKSLLALLFQAGLTAQSAEEAEDAAQIFGMVLAWEQQNYNSSSPWWQSDQGQSISARIVDRLGAEAMERAIAEGKRLTMADLLAITDRITAPAQPAPSSAAPTTREASDITQGSLTPREVEVLRLVANGLTNAQVAQTLVITPRTVNGHLTSIYAKLGVTSRGGAIRYALEHSLA